MDTVLATRDWLRNQSLGHPVNAGGTSRADGARQTVVYRAGGAPDPAVHQVAHVLLGVDVWGDSYDQVGRDADAIAALFAGIARTDLATGCMAYGATVESDQDRPDPSSHQPRRALTVRVSVLNTGDN